MKKKRTKLTVNQKLVLAKVKKQILANTKVNVSAAMREVYAPSTATSTGIITNLPEFKDLLEKYLPEDDILSVHKGLMMSTKMDHMVFPLGPEGEDEINLSGGVNPPEDVEVEEGDIDEEDEEPEFKAERTTLTDKEIVAMLAEVNCTVRRIVHGNSARHVYFWAPDNRARKDGLDMAYKIRNRYPKDTPQLGIQFNFGVK